MGRAPTLRARIGRASRGRGPRRDREADRVPREYQSGPKADSPFAVLAQLKLKKD
jgi:hypothetical protein